MFYRTNPYFRRWNPYLHINAALPDAVPAPELDDVGMTPLHWAVFYGDEPAIEELLAAGANVDTRDRLGRTPLHVAADNDRVPIIQLLLDRRADIDARDEDGSTPLHYAASGGRVAAIRALLARGANIRAQNNAGQMPYQVAETMGRIAVRDLLFPRTTPDQILRFQSGVRVGDVRYVIDMIHAHPGIVNARHHDETPLHLAAENGHIPIIELLLAHRANIEARNNVGETPLHYAAARGHEPAIRLLLAHRANKAAQNNAGQLPYQLAEARGHMAAGDILRPLTPWEIGAFFVNIGAGQIPVLQTAIQAHPDFVYARGLIGYTPLHVAAAYGQVPVIQLLLARGADRLARDNAGQQPYQLAEAAGHMAARDLLIPPAPPVL